MEVSHACHTACPAHRANFANIWTWQGVLYILAQLASLVRLMELHVRKGINTSKKLLEMLEEFIIFFLVKCSGMVERSLKCKFTILLE